jgi:3-oxoacyl-[acyl-carrier protein] reductase
MIDSARHVLITGASRGIGRAIAEAFAAAGDHVVGTATSAHGAAALGELLAPSGGLGEMVDVSSTQSVADLFQRLGESGRLPQVVVNNAGITRDNLLARMKDEEWEEVIQTNLGSLFRIGKAASRSMMKARWGRIINIGSVVGATGNAGQSNYAASKAGLEGFTRALARELGGRAITVNAIAPGFIDTDMTRALPEGQRDALCARIPLKRLGSGADVAHAALFLASEQAGYITGATLHVNGGLHMG